MGLMQLHRMTGGAISQLSGVLATYTIPVQLIDALTNQRTYQRMFNSSGESIIIGVENGEITGFYGAIVDGLQTHTCEEGITHLMGMGHSYEETLTIIKCKLLQKLICLPPQTTFKPNQRDLGRPMSLPTKMGEDLANILKSEQVEEEMLRTYGLALSERIVWTDLSTDIVQFKLSLQLLKDYRKMNSASTIGQALDVDNRVTDLWRSFDIFMSLGLVSMAKQTESVAEVPVNVDRVQELEALLVQFRSQPAYVTFELNAPNEVNDKHIGQVFRTLSKEYHPDRFGKVSTVEKDLIVEVYSLINDLHMELQNEEYRAELKKRLDVERRGLQYVSDDDEKKSEVLYAQGTFFYRKKKYTEALEVLDKAYVINPYNWRINTTRVRCQAELGQIPMKEAGEILAANKDARGSDRVDLLFQAGQYYFKDGEENEAYELFKKVVELDDGHIDAKRYLHLRSKRAQVQEQPQQETKGSFFSRLFGKK